MGALVLAGCAGGGRDDGEFDLIHADFEEDPDAFLAAVENMAAVRAEHPTAELISYTRNRVCVLEPDFDDPILDRDCRETTMGEQRVITEVPRTDGLVLLAADGDRFMFRYGIQEPPVYTLMFVPGDEQTQDFTQAAGFRSARPIEQSWTILGPIEDDAARRALWLE
ncbi:MAG: hypothetical protein AAFO29_08830 [Actinomycetota bacterium]